MRGRPRPTTPERPWLVPALLVAATLAVFHAAFAAGFVEWDDRLHVFANPHITPTPHLAVFWRAPFQGLYIPLTYTAWAALAAAFGLRPEAFHVLNLALHAGSVALLFRLLERVVHDRRAAALGALLFAIHPLQVESVLWVSELKGLLAGFFGLLAVHLVLDGAAAPGDPAAQGRRGWRYVSASAAFAAALLSKPAAVVVPALAFVVGRWGLALPARALAVRLVPWLCGSTALALLTRAAQSEAAAVAIWQRPLIAGDALAFYLGKLAAPWPLTFDYGRTPAVALAGAWSHVAWLVPLVAAIAVWRARRPSLSAGALWAAIAVAPVSGLVPFLFQTTSTVADRYAYVPLMGAALALAGLLRGRSARAVRTTGAVLAGFGVVAAVQAHVWKDNHALFRHALDVDPSSFTARTLLGTALAIDDDDHAGALREYEAALRLRPGDAETLNSIGLSLAALGRMPEAIAAYRQAVQRKPVFPEAHYDLARALLFSGAVGEGGAELREALREDPGLEAARDALAQMGRAARPDATTVDRMAFAAACEQHGNVEGAAGALREAVRLDPGGVEAPLALAALLRRHGRREAAASALREALARHPDSARVAIDLGLDLVQLHHDDEAAAILRQAVRLDPGLRERLRQAGLPGLDD